MNSNTRQSPAPTKPGATTNTATPAQPDKLIRIKTVCELSGLGKTSVYSIPDFPKRVIKATDAITKTPEEIAAVALLLAQMGAKLTLKHSVMIIGELL